MQATRFSAMLLAAALLLAGPGCGRDASFHREEAFLLSCDVVVLGDTLGALVSALEASMEGAAVVLLYGQLRHDPWLLEEGAAAAAAALPNEDGGEKGTAAETYSASDLRQALGHSGGAWGQTWHYDLLAAEAYTGLYRFAGFMGISPEQIQPGLFRLQPLTYDQACLGLVRAAGEHGVRPIGGTVVEAIEPAGDGGCITLRVRIPGGRIVPVYTRAVIMAQGGYLEDRELMQEVAAGVRTAPWRNAGDGEAVRLAINLNLDLVQLDHFAYSLAVEEGGEWVKARYPEQALLIAGGQVQPVRGMTPEEILAVLLQQENERTGRLVVAETRLPELERGSLSWARYTGIDSFLEAQLLDPPLLRRWFDRPWDTYYGTSIAALAEYCLGGVAVNEQGQVLRAGEPVGGLFALGETAGGLHGRGLLPGAALSEVLVWGRRIGREAARLAQH